VEDAVDANDLGTWIFNITRIWRGDSEPINGDDAIDVIKRNTASFCEPFKSAVESIPKGSPAFVRSLYYWRPVPWPNHQGRVTLAGDAAHPMLPCRLSLRLHCAFAGWYLLISLE
jgi:2-polyprenyl-6-methoxyphenol hydroxylase-like FAD-dependent oxidoreductase